MIQTHPPARAGLTAPELLEAAADRIHTYCWYDGSDGGYYKHSLFDARPPRVRPATGYAHILFAAGLEFPHWAVEPASLPGVVTEALGLLATHLYKLAADDGRREDSDGFLDLAAQIRAFEAREGMTETEVEQTWRDCAKAVRAQVAASQLAGAA